MLLCDDAYKLYHPLQVERRLGDVCAMDGAAPLPWTMDEEAASRLAVLCSRLLLGGHMPQASSSFASLCDWLLEALQSGRTACATTLILVPLLSLLIAASWGLLLPQQLLLAPPAPLETPEPERAVAEPPSEPEEPEPLLTPTPPADGKPPEVLLAHTPDSFVAAVREPLGCRTQLPRKVYGAY